MIVYADREDRIETRPALEALIQRIGHGDPVDILIRYGQLESGIADALQPEADDWNKTIEELRFAAILLAMAASHRGCEFDYDFRRLLSFDLPERINVRPPEGFAYYAVYPEQYRAAAQQFIEEVHPKRCGVIGIRSIGATLSAIVAESVFSDECDVFTYTVRPRGHPFERQVQLTTRAVEAIKAAAADHFLVVDEGPGISGSSFAAVCRMLENDVGVPRDRIVLFPSWDAPAEVLRSEAGRTEWSAHRRYVTSFEEACLPKLSADHVIDISAGAWRRYLFASEEEYPAVQPQHERRKYVTLQGSTQLLYKFAGLADLGRDRFRRAGVLSRERFIPEANDFKDGFLVTVFQQGRPLTPADLSAELIVRMAEYLAFIRNAFPLNGTDRGDLQDMVVVNVREAMGDAAAEKILCSDFKQAVSSRTTVALDGRMLPHEWIQTAGEYLKTDAVDHWDDHFFPGSRDIAWDVAGSIIEWQMPAEARVRFVREFVDRTGERDLEGRLPHFEIAYLAYRIGYATMAIDALAHDPAESARFRSLLEQYRAAMQSRVERL